MSADRGRNDIGVRAAKFAAFGRRSAEDVALPRAGLAPARRSAAALRGRRERTSASPCEAAIWSRLRLGVVGRTVPPPSRAVWLQHSRARLRDVCDANLHGCGCGNRFSAPGRHAATRAFEPMLLRPSRPDARWRNRSDMLGLPTNKCENRSTLQAEEIHESSDYRLVRRCLPSRRCSHPRARSPRSAPSRSPASAPSPASSACSASTAKRR